MMHFQQEILYLKRAPEPSDILWENLQFTRVERNRYKVFSFMYSCLYLFLAFIFLLSFIYANRQLEVCLCELKKGVIL